MIGSGGRVEDRLDRFDLFKMGIALLSRCGEQCMLGGRRRIVSGWE